MPGTSPRFVGTELYFDNLEAAKRFYEDVLGLKLTDQASGHYAQFAAGEGFVCLERKGSESYHHRTKQFCSSRSPTFRAPPRRSGQTGSSPASQQATAVARGQSSTTPKGTTCSYSSPVQRSKHALDGH